MDEVEVKIRADLPEYLTTRRLTNRLRLAMIADYNSTFSQPINKGVVSPCRLRIMRSRLLKEKYLRGR